MNVLTHNGRSLPKKIRHGSAVVSGVWHEAMHPKLFHVRSGYAGFRARGTPHSHHGKSKLSQIFRSLFISRPVRGLVCYTTVMGLVADWREHTSADANESTTLFFAKGGAN